MKRGYLYVLVHPSDPSLYKIGVTVLHPEQRLAQHNQLHDSYAGRVVQQTGQTWQLKTFIEVEDPYWAEKAFWAATPISDIPYRNGVEVERLEWQDVLAGLQSAHRAGVRPPVVPPKRNREWMLRQLEGTGISMVGPYRGLITNVEFECQQGHLFKEMPGLLANLKSCPCCQDWGYSGGFRKGLRPSLRTRSDFEGEAGEDAHG